MNPDRYSVPFGPREPFFFSLLSPVRVASQSMRQPGDRAGAMSGQEHERAALTLVSVTAWNALVAKARLSAGQSVFITGCLGGVGRSAVQIARMRGVNVVGSCSASGREAALALGVGEVVDYRAFDIAPYRHRFDVVFDAAGALSLSRCGAMLKRRGMSLHTVPTPAKLIGCLLPSRHHLVFGNPTPQCMAGIAEALDRVQLVPASAASCRCPRRSRPSSNSRGEAPLTESW